MSPMGVRTEVPWERYRHTLGRQVGPAEKESQSKKAAKKLSFGTIEQSAACIHLRSQSKESEAKDEFLAVFRFACTSFAMQNALLDHIIKPQIIIVLGI